MTLCFFLEFKTDVTRRLGDSIEYGINEIKVNNEIEQTCLFNNEAQAFSDAKIVLEEIKRKAVRRDRFAEETQLKRDRVHNPLIPSHDQAAPLPDWDSQS